MTQRFDDAETIRDKVTTQAMIAIIWITHQVDRISASLKTGLRHFFLPYATRSASTSVACMARVAALARTLLRFAGSAAMES